MKEYWRVALFARRAFMAWFDRRKAALRPAFIFCLASAIWIAVSDRLAAYLAGGVSQLTWFQTLKGWLWVLFATTLMYWLIRRELRHRREAHVEAEKARERLTHILESTSEYFFALDRDWRFTYINGRAAEFFGRPVRQLLGRSLWHQFPTTVDSVIFHEYHRAMEERAPAVIEAESSIHSGRWLRVHVHPTDEGLAVFSRDVTERRRVTEALRKSEERSRILVRAAPIGVFLETTRGEILSCNPAAARMFGYDSPEEMVGLTIADTVPAGFAATLPDVIAEDTGGIALERVNKRKDGTLFPAEVATRLYDVGGEKRLIAYVRDVTEQKHAEGALRESEERYRLLIETSPDIVGVHHQGRILYVNPAGATLLGAHDPEELVGRPVMEFVHPDYREFVAERMRQADEDNRPLERAEEKLITLDGEVRDVEITGSPVTYRGKRASQLIVRDITERKRLEHQFQHAQKMEAIGRLAGGVAHDFNNMLTAIKGYAQLTRQALDTEDPVREDVDEVLSAADRASGLVRQLLAFSRKDVTEPRVIVPARVIADIEKMLQHVTGDDIDLVASYNGDDSQGHVRADPAQLERVLINLAVNARDAMPDGGRLTIRVARTRIEGNEARVQAIQPGPYVRLSVADEGSGIDESMRARIFEPFFTTKEPGKGTGLGLSTVYGIVRQCGGSIDIDSSPGEGTTFHIFLPEVEAGEPEDSTIVEAAPAGAGETILLAEDQSSVRRLARRALEQKGYRVIEAENGAKALERYESHEGAIDLLLTDIRMPGMNGGELADRLRREHADLAVLLMSGYTDDSAVRERVRKAGSHFIPKPFSPEELVRKVREVLDAKPAVS